MEGLFCLSLDVLNDYVYPLLGLADRKNLAVVCARLYEAQRCCSAYHDTWLVPSIEWLRDTRYVWRRNIRYLRFITSFDPPFISPGDIPSSARTINFGSTFNAFIKPGAIPDGTRSITLGNLGYSKILSRTNVPASVKEIHINMWKSALKRRGNFLHDLLDIIKGKTYEEHQPSGPRGPRTGFAMEFEHGFTETDVGRRTFLGAGHDFLTQAHTMGINYGAYDSRQHMEDSFYFQGVIK
jgi:hypothetical protein